MAMNHQDIVVSMGLAQLELLTTVYENTAAGRSLFHVRHKITQNHYALTKPLCTKSI